ncbi:MAG: hypothetical protein P9M03_09940 [Candidatus Theseobacter exili]|nr:hypothetical protein [Candidatus Theseobacter exili]
MKSGDKFVVFLLSLIVIAFLTVTLASGFCHHHEDSDYHDDCFACKLVISFVAAILHVFVSFAGRSFSFVVLHRIPSIFSSVLLNSVRTRAPPILSCI